MYNVHACIPASFPNLAMMLGGRGEERERDYCRQQGMREAGNRSCDSWRAHSFGTKMAYLVHMTVNSIGIPGCTESRLS